MDYERPLRDAGDHELRTMFQSYVPLAIRLVYDLLLSNREIRLELCELPWKIRGLGIRWLECKKWAPEVW